MKTQQFGAVVAWVVLAGTLTGSAAASAQAAEVKEKPPMYTYVSSWVFPRGKWAEAEKPNANDQKVLDKAFNSGAIVAYGNDATLIHSSDGYTHDNFWSGMSMAAVLGVLEDLEKGGSSAAPLLISATKHEDALVVSRYYNWKPGTLKGAYTHEAAYSLKENAPDNAVDVISKSFAVPLLEKLVADGTIVEYEIDEEQIHTQAPGRFWVIYITKSAADLDKVNTAISSAFDQSPFIGPALDTMVDSSKHRDYLVRTNGIYK